MNKRCGHCKKIYTVDARSTDYVHDCSYAPKNPVLAQTDVLRIGAWIDADGTSDLSGETSRSLQNSGFVDKLVMTTAKVDGAERLDNKSVRGSNKSVTRARNVFHYEEIKRC